MKAQQRTRVASKRRTDGGRVGSPQHRVQIPEHEVLEELGTAHHNVDAAADQRIAHPASKPPPGHPGHESAQLARRLAGHALAHRPANLPQDPRQSGNAVAVEEVGTVGIEHRIEHEALHPSGIAACVGHRHLRPVGNAEQRETLHPDRPAHRLDVLHRIEGRVEGPPSAELTGALARLVGHAGRNGQRCRTRPRRTSAGGKAGLVARAPGAALVEDHEVVGLGRAREGRQQRLPDGGAVGDGHRGRLSRPTGQGQDRARTGARSGPALHAQAHLSFHVAGAVERNLHPLRFETGLRRALRGSLSGSRRPGADRQESRNRPCAPKPAHCSRSSVFLPGHLRPAVDETGSHRDNA